MGHELAAFRAMSGRGDTDLYPELVWPMGLALADALDFRGVQGIGPWVRVDVDVRQHRRERLSGWAKIYSSSESCLALDTDEHVARSTLTDCWRPHDAGPLAQFAHFVGRHFLLGGVHCREPSACPAPLKTRGMPGARREQTAAQAKPICLCTECVRRPFSTATVTWLPRVRSALMMALSPFFGNSMSRRAVFPATDTGSSCLARPRSFRVVTPSASNTLRPSTCTTTWSLSKPSVR